MIGVIVRCFPSNHPPSIWVPVTGLDQALRECVGLLLVVHVIEIDGEVVMNLMAFSSSS